MSTGEDQRGVEDGKELIESRMVALALENHSKGAQR